MKADDRKSLRRAVKDNDLDKHRELIAVHGPNVSVYSKVRHSLLHDVCGEDRPATVHLLIKKGANINARNSSEATPLHIACFNGCINSVRLLIESVADVEMIDINNLTPFDDICQSRADVFDETYAEIGDILLAHGINIDSFISENETNLHYACRNIQVNVVRFLLSRGADPTICDYFDSTPLDIAMGLPRDIPEREEILNLFCEFHPELYFSTFCTQFPGGV